MILPHAVVATEGAAGLDLRTPERPGVDDQPAPSGCIHDGDFIIDQAAPPPLCRLGPGGNDRLHRQGQRSATTSVIYLVAEGTVEQDAMAALREKADGQNAMMDAIKARIRKYTA